MTGMKSGAPSYSAASASTNDVQTNKCMTDRCELRVSFAYRQKRDQNVSDATSRGEQHRSTRRDATRRDVFRFFLLRRVGIGFSVGRSSPLHQSLFSLKTPFQTTNNKTHSHVRSCRSPCRCQVSSIARCCTIGYPCVESAASLSVTLHVRTHRQASKQARLECADAVKLHWIDDLKTCSSSRTR